MTETKLSRAMVSALQAVARMKGDSAIAWSDLLAEGQRDDRIAPTEEPDPRQGSKPAGR